MQTFIEDNLRLRRGSVLVQRDVETFTWGSIFCSKLAHALLIALLLAAVTPSLAYFFVISRNVTHDDAERYYCLVREDFILPCGNANITQKQCESVNCCFNTTTQRCHHFLPSKYYYSSSGSDGKYTASQKESPVGSTSLEHLKLTIQNKTANKLSIIIHDSSETVEPMSTNHTNYSISQSTKKLIVEVFDKDGDSIFSTTKGALVASDMYWEWSFQLTNGTLFGLDRNLIKLETSETLTKVVYKNGVDHFTLPVLWAYLNGKFYGAVIKHDGPLEIQVLASNMIILRSLLGKRIEVELSLGPTPADLFESQTEEMALPPLWSLGTHNCRSGNSTSLKEILEIYQANRASNFDTDCIHENIVMALQKSSTTDDDLALLKTHIDEIRGAGKRFLLALPPHILIDESNELYAVAKKKDLLYKYQSGIVYNGTYLQEKVVYPDYSSEYISDYIGVLMKWIDSTLGLEHISGLVLNDNWPRDDGYRNVEKTEFPYFTGAIDKQMQYTLPWSLFTTNKTLHLEKHNLYGQFQKAAIKAYFKTMPLQEPLIISSTKMYDDTQPQIAENFGTSWDDFRVYLNRILFSSITGNRMVGLPVCGDTADYNSTLHETLCMRWYIAAATMPYFRVSSGNVFRDPSNLNSKYAAKVAETAMDIRAHLQDYLYTILAKKEPLVRPLYYDYYSNPETFSIQRQYTVGKDITVAQPFSSGRTRLQVYLPPERGVWYEFWGGTMFTAHKKNKYYVDVDTLETDWTMLIAEGSIVVLTESTKLRPYIALKCSSSGNACEASGVLLKDNTLLSFTATNTSVTINGLPENCNYSVDYMRVYGYQDDSGYSLTLTEIVDLCSSGAKTVTIDYTH